MKVFYPLLSSSSSSWKSATTTTIIVLILLAQRLQGSDAATRKQTYKGSCALDLETVMVEWDAGLRIFFPSHLGGNRYSSRRRGLTHKDNTDDDVTSDQGAYNLEYGYDHQEYGHDDSEAEHLYMGNVANKDLHALPVLQRQGRHSYLRNLSKPADRKVQKSQVREFPARRCSCASQYRNTNNNMSHYCLALNNENVCRVPVDDDQAIECLEVKSSQGFIRNAWPVAVLWLATMVLYLFTTTGGRFSLRYFCFKVSKCVRMGLCCRGRGCCGGRGRGGNTTNGGNINAASEWPNHGIINQVIALEERARRRYQQQRISLSGEGGVPTSPPDRVTYVLKTTQFVKKSMSFSLSLSSSEQTLPMTPDRTQSFESTKKNNEHDDDNDHDEHDDDVDECCAPSTSPNDSHQQQQQQQQQQQERSHDEQNDNTMDNDNNHDTFSDNDEILCTICIATIEDGDRVGVLPCDHLFHSECLKSWIKRKNTCPLCQTPDIAREKDMMHTSSNPHAQPLEDSGRESENSSGGSQGNSSSSDDRNQSPSGHQDGEGSSPAAIQRTVRTTGMDWNQRSRSSPEHTAAHPTVRTRGVHVGTASIQRQWFQVNRGRGRLTTSTPRLTTTTTTTHTNTNTSTPTNGGRRGGETVVGVGTVRIRIDPNRNNSTTRESPSQRRARLNNMRRAWNPT